MPTRRIVQLLNLLALIVAIAWLVHEPSFATVIGVLTLLATLIGLLFEETISSKKKADLELFRKLKEDLPYEGSIRFIDENNFAGFPFKISALSDLYLFERVWNSAEHEFLIKKIEKRRLRLLHLIREYLPVIGLETFPTNTAGWNSVPQEWEFEQSERFNRTVGKLHTLAGEIVEAHQDLFRTARAILKC